ncbi:hypothetical protein BD414DRAFT_492667 [Trametes punicea]|nr:hypothetical protein BD414DRAFT_492667 [Trametes punicea]
MGQSPLDIDMGPLNAAASSSRATDVVTQFLVEQGLSASFAQALRSVGISDHSRMRMLGALPETDLDKLGEKLACEGLDFVACLLVRGGLRRYARAGLR